MSMRCGKYKKISIVAAGVAPTPAAVKKAEEKQEKVVEQKTEEELKSQRKKQFAAWSKF